jgi:hypothetical protein
MVSLSLLEPDHDNTTTLAHPLPPLKHLDSEAALALVIARFTKPTLTQSKLKTETPPMSGA